MSTLTEEQKDVQAFVKACKSGDVPAIRALIDKQAKIDRFDFVNKCDKNGSTPVFHPVWPGHVDAVRVLLESGADPNVQNNRLNTALHLACEQKHKDIIAVMVEYGADINLGNSEGIYCWDKAPNDEIKNFTIQCVVKRDGNWENPREAAKKKKKNTGTVSKEAITEAVWEFMEKRMASGIPVCVCGTYPVNLGDRTAEQVGKRTERLQRKHTILRARLDNLYGRYVRDTGSWSAHTEVSRLPSRRAKRIADARYHRQFPSEHEHKEGSGKAPATLTQLVSSAGSGGTDGTQKHGGGGMASHVGHYLDHQNRPRSGGGVVLPDSPGGVISPLQRVSGANGLPKGPCVGIGCRKHQQQWTSLRKAMGGKSLDAQAPTATPRFMAPTYAHTQRAEDPEVAKQMAKVAQVFRARTRRARRRKNGKKRGKSKTGKAPGAEPEPEEEGKTFLDAVTTHSILVAHRKIQGYRGRHGRHMRRLAGQSQHSGMLKSADRALLLAAGGKRKARKKGKRRKKRVAQTETAADQLQGPPPPPRECMYCVHFCVHGTPGTANGTLVAGGDSTVAPESKTQSPAQQHAQRLPPPPPGPQQIAQMFPLHHPQCPYFSGAALASPGVSPAQTSPVGAEEHGLTRFPAPQPLSTAAASPTSPRAAWMPSQLTPQNLRYDPLAERQGWSVTPDGAATTTSNVASAPAEYSAVKMPDPWVHQLASISGWLDSLLQQTGSDPRRQQERYGHAHRPHTAGSSRSHLHALERPQSATAHTPVSTQGAWVAYSHDPDPHTYQAFRSPANARQRQLNGDVGGGSGVRKRRVRRRRPKSAAPRRSRVSGAAQRSNVMNTVARMSGDSDDVEYRHTPIRTSASAHPLNTRLHVEQKVQE